MSSTEGTGDIDDLGGTADTAGAAPSGTGDVGGAVTPAPGAPEVAVHHLRASYDRTVLTDVSFVAAPGAVTVVSGPSGIGKSTLLRILLGRQGPDRGEITVAGRSLIGASGSQLAEIHARTGFLFTGLDAGSDGRKGFSPGSIRDPDEGIDPKRTVADHVRDATADDEQARRCLADFDLSGVADERADRLDAGARRRLGLARLFAADPLLVLLDDPVAALDPDDRDAVVASLARARASSPAGSPTVLIACHDLTATRALGDHLVTLVSGRVGRTGPVPQLLEGIETDHEFATAFAVGGKRIADTSSEALGEHKFGVGLHTFDQRTYVVGLSVLGVLFLLAVFVLIGLRVLL